MPLPCTSEQSATMSGHSVFDSEAWSTSEENRMTLIDFDPDFYHSRNLVEGLFSRFKQCRRIATRYQADGAKYLKGRHGVHTSVRAYR
jgi:hypothetical protein